MKSLTIVQQYFSYIMATSFSGGRSRSTWREPPTMGTAYICDVIRSECTSHTDSKYEYDRLP
jgi:hypothetical protein